MPELKSNMRPPISTKEIHQQQVNIAVPSAIAHPDEETFPINYREISAVGGQMKITLDGFLFNPSG